MKTGGYHALLLYLFPNLNLKTDGSGSDGLISIRYADCMTTETVVEEGEDTLWSLLCLSNKIELIQAL